MRPDQVVLLTSGEMIPRKNQEVLFRMLARMKDEPHRSAYEKLHLLLCGHGELNEHLHGLADRLGIADHISFFRIQGRYAGDLWSFGYLPFSIPSGRAAAGDAGGYGQRASGYGIIRILCRRCIMLAPTEELATLPALKKQIVKIQQIDNVPVVFELTTISNYRRKSLIENNIPFITDKQVFLPFIGTMLSDEKKNPKS